MNKLIFREYDIRGLYPEELSLDVCAAIFYALGLECVKKGCKSISIGHDARLSANALLSVAIRGLKDAGMRVINLGLIPTPLGYFSVFMDSGFDANVVITGSHNAKEYNGFKITINKESYFGKDLQHLAKEAQKYLNHELKSDEVCEKFDIITPYVNYLAKAFSHLKGYKLPLVIDVFNGAGGEVISKLVKELDLNAKLINTKPDGNFTKHDPDPSCEENLQELKSSLNKNSLGFAFDGDADRLAVIDKNRIYKGDELCYLLACELDNPRVMGEVKCFASLYEEVAKFGSIFMGKTGHSNIKKAMKELKIDLAAELSGHFFFKDRYFGYDDGIYALFRVLELPFRGVDMNAKLNLLPKSFTSQEIKIKVNEKEKFDLVDRFKNAALKEFNYKEKCEIDGLRLGFDDGWVLLRASNTSPYLIIRSESRSLEKMNHYLQITKDLLEVLRK